jgi:hypothetical protein
VTAGAVELAAGASMDVPVWWNISGAAKGTYDGVMTITAASSGAQIHVPYWYAATSGTPAHVTILDSLTSARRSSMQQDAILFRITDVSGLALTGVQPQVTVVSGGGTFLGLNSYDDQVPGLFGIDVRLGPSAGTNVFRLQVGGVTAEVSISGL